MKRCLLHKSKVEAFKAWLVAQDIEHRDGADYYELLQVRVPGSRAMAKLYQRHHMPEHVTVQEALLPLVRRFIKETRS